MRKGAWTAAFMALSLDAAFAADLPKTKAPPAPPPPPPPLLWTGFHVGLNGGGTWNQSSVVTLPSFDSGAGGFAAAQRAGAIPTQLSISNGAFIGGGQIGYNYQFNSLVAGVEADLQGIAGGANLAQVAAPVPLTFFKPAVAQVTRSSDYLATVRGRLGFLVLPNVLTYATAGLAVGGTNLSAAFVGAWSPILLGGATYSTARTGWTAGGGVEWRVNETWSVKGEYLYYDLGSASTPPIDYAYGANISAITATSRFNGHIIRAGANYHFNLAPPTPAVAKF